MTQELLYTSAPQGLKPGSRGFCTVVSTQGMSAPLAAGLESLSGYRPVFPPGHPQADKNPVNFSHLRLDVAGRSYNVLSRIADYGLDYSRRTNKLAHHVVLQPKETNLGGPAWLLSQPRFMESDWDGQLRILPRGRTIKPGDSQPRVCEAWRDMAGDAGWAGVLAEAFLADPQRLVYLMFEPGMDPLPLIAEASALLPPQYRWNVTFSTYFTQLPPGALCQWRCVLNGSPEANQSRRFVRALRINLCEPPGRAEGGPLVECARTGKLPQTVWEDCLAGGDSEQSLAPTSHSSGAPPAIQGGYKLRTTPAAPPPLPRRRRRKSNRRLTGPYWLVALIVLLVVGVGGGAAWMWLRAGKDALQVAESRPADQANPFESDNVPTVAAEDSQPSAPDDTGPPPQGDSAATVADADDQNSSAAQDQSEQETMAENSEGTPPSTQEATPADSVVQSQENPPQEDHMDEAQLAEPMPVVDQPGAGEPSSDSIVQSEAEQASKWKVLRVDLPGTVKQNFPLIEFDTYEEQRGSHPYQLHLHLPASYEGKFRKVQVADPVSLKVLAQATSVLPAAEIKISRQFGSRNSLHEALVFRWQGLRPREALRSGIVELVSPESRHLIVLHKIPKESRPEGHKGGKFKLPSWIPVNDLHVDSLQLSCQGREFRFTPVTERATKASLLTSADFLQYLESAGILRQVRSRISIIQMNTGSSSVEFKPDANILNEVNSGFDQQCDKLLQLLQKDELAVSGQKPLRLTPVIGAGKPNTAKVKVAQLTHKFKEGIKKGDTRTGRVLVREIEEHIKRWTTAKDSRQDLQQNQPHYQKHIDQLKEAIQDIESLEQVAKTWADIRKDLQKMNIVSTRIYYEISLGEGREPFQADVVHFK